jgi:hypothetical protein
MEEEDKEDGEEEQVKKVEKVAEQTKKEESEDDAVDDWENADLDEIADKIKNKEVALVLPEDEDNQ